LCPRKEHNYNKKENNIASENSVDKGDNYCNIEMGNVDNIDVINLFDSQTSDHVINKCDHDYEKIPYKMITVKSEGDEEQDNVMELNNEVPPPANIDPTVQTDTINIGYLGLKPSNENELSLCYSDPLVINNNEGIMASENAEIHDNDLVTCNVEIISLDQPKTELYIDDQPSDQESDEEQPYDEKVDEHDFYFCIKSDLNATKNIIYNREDLMCIYCNYKDMVVANLYQHMCDNHPQQLHVNHEIKLQDNVDNIKVMKFSKYKEMCFRNKTDYSRKNRNTERQDLAGEFPCAKCDKVFTRMRYLKKHIILHKAEKPYLCDFCGKSFKTRTYLTVHHRSHAKKVYKCDQCDFTSSTTALIRLHRQQHNNGCVLCDICGNAYSDKSTLSKHKRVHDPNRPYQCNYPGCTWRFLTEVMCRAHQRNHDTEGKFICMHCGYAFRHKHHVKRHEARVHGIRNQPDKAADRANAQKEMPTVNVVVESTEESSCIQESVPGGQLVITTDAEGNAVNYHLAEISNVALVGSEEGRTIIIPQIDYGNIVLQRVDHSEQESPFIKVTEVEENL
jgi:KRAB domain-containing zinc finger protein